MDDLIFKPLPFEWNVEIPAEAEDGPRVVLCSGGQSSAFLLVQMLYHGDLDPDRGDVIVFNNTSAEHPRTYDFIVNLMQYAEEEYGIPAFITEYCGYEGITKGIPTRRASYRLTNRRPYSEENPDGYHNRLEVFEEVLSQSGALPNSLQRFCTVQMKIRMNNRFLSDWLKRQDLDQQGNTTCDSLITDDGLIALHEKSGGKLPRETLLKMRQYARSRPMFRKRQRLQDYTNTDITYCPPEDGSIPRYTSIVGFRADEAQRVSRMKARQNICGSARKRGVELLESKAFPMATSGIRLRDVTEFWQRQPWKLEIPRVMSNCVFCFMKRPSELKEIAVSLKDSDKSNDLIGTGADIYAWKRLEKQYSQDKTYSFFKAVKDMTYDKLQQISDTDDEQIDLLQSLYDSNGMSCHCTD